MRIALDIDNVTTDTIKSTYKVVNKCKYKNELLQRIDKIVNANLDDEYTKHFYEKHALEVFSDASLKEGTKEYIEKLKSDGHTIIFITSRGDQNEYYIGTEKITIDFFKKHKIPYDKIIFNTTKKEIACKNENIDILLDDNVTFCKNVNDVGIKTIIFNTKENKNIDAGNIMRVNSWKEFYEYIKKNGLSSFF